MEPRTVGRCGLRLSPVGLGTAGWGRATPVEDALSIAGKFLEWGSASGAPLLLDTSPAYGEGSSAAAGAHAAEENAGRVLGQLPREQLVVSTSSGVDPTAPLGRRVDCSRRHLLNQLEESLRRLGTDHLDIWSVGYWDRLTPPDEVAATIGDAITSGKTRYAAVRDYSGWQLALTAARCPQVIAAQTEYSLLQRDCEEHLVPACEFLGLGVIAAAPLAKGLLAGPGDRPLRADAHPLLGPRTTTIVEALRTAAAGLDIAPSTAALNWVLGRPGVAVAVVGPRTPEQARELLAGAGRVLPEAIARALEDVSA